MSTYSTSFSRGIVVEYSFTYVMVKVYVDCESALIVLLFSCEELAVWVIYLEKKFHITMIIIFFPF